MADKNYISYADVDGETIENTVFPAAGTNQSEFSDILKLSHAKNTVVRGCHIYGGKEDCVDMNRNCENILIENCTVYPFGSYGFTIKGGAKNITLRNVIFDGHGGEADIDLGNWSDQSMEQTKNVVLENVRTLDGSPVKVRVLWAEKPTIVDSNVKLLVIPKPIIWAYRWLRARKLVP